jgi:glycosyltransferase involved in cell wall biosynthesis
MGFADRYIAKNKGAFFFEPTKILPLRIIVVIPCFNEPEIGHTISSLFNCDHPGVETGIVVLVNSSENSTQDALIQNRKTSTELKAISEENDLKFHLFVIEVENLPQKHGGVGWARKIGMDWAVVHFNHFGFNDGIILSLDADTLVENNYLTSAYNFFKGHPEKVASTFYFEHSFHPSDFRSDNLERHLIYMNFTCVITGTHCCFQDLPIQSIQ